MNLPQWYTGSDRSGQVVAGIEETISNMDEHQAGSADIERLGELLELEEENNWRAFLLSLVGTILFDLEKYDEAAETLQGALAVYEVHLPSFDEVLSVYCQSCYTLGILFFDRELYSEAIPCLLRCLPYVHEVSDEAYLGDIYTILNVSYSMIDDFSTALIFAEAAVFARNHDCESLENLMVACYGVGEIDRAIDVFHVLKESCRDTEGFDRILDFAREKLGTTTMVN